VNYQSFQPHPDLSALVKFYWTLEVPYDPKNERQKIIPDGCIEMTFNFKDKIRRYLTDKDFVVHPNAMIMGAITKSFHIEPLGDVDSFSVCFYPHGFASFVNISLEELVDTEAPIEQFFGKKAATELEQKMMEANDTQERILIIESFLLDKLHDNATIDHLVKSTVNALLESGGSNAIIEILKDDLSKRRQLERKFKKQVGLSPKQLGKVLRLQSALKLMLEDKKSLTSVAYESAYFDQAHFTRDFKEFIGTTPGKFFKDESLALSTLFYQ